MKTPAEAVLLILSFEQLRLYPYRDAAGVLTWGWGHRQRGAEKPPSGLTREAANAIFLADLAAAEDAAYGAVGSTPLTANRLGALVSLAFNVGGQALRDSTLVKLVRAGDYNGARLEFARWCHVTVGGRKVVSAGLVERRAAEARLWGES